MTPEIFHLSNIKVLRDNEPAGDAVGFALGERVTCSEAAARTSQADACIRQLMWIDPGNPVLALAHDEATSGRRTPISFVRERRLAEARFGSLFVSVRARDGGFKFPSPAERLSPLWSDGGTLAGLAQGSVPSPPPGRPSAATPSSEEASRAPSSAVRFRSPCSNISISSASSRDWACTAWCSVSRSMGSGMAFLAWLGGEP